MWWGGSVRPPAPVWLPTMYSFTDYVYYGRLLFEHDHEHLETIGIVHTQDVDIEVRHVLKELCDGRLLAYAQRDPFGELQRLPSVFWKSVVWADIDWHLSSIPKYGLLSVHVELALPQEPRRRGPQPKTRARVLAEMQRLVEAGGRERLAGMKQQSLSLEFHASQSLCRECRQQVMAVAVSSV